MADMRVLDASWYMPNAGKLILSPNFKVWHPYDLTCTSHIKPEFAGRDPRQDFVESRIPGSRFFDLDRISDPNTDLPHMLPSEKAFAAAADALGISADDQVQTIVFALQRLPGLYNTYKNEMGFMCV